MQDNKNSRDKWRHYLHKQRIWHAKYSLLGSAAPKTPQKGWWLIEK